MAAAFTLLTESSDPRSAGRTNFSWSLGYAIATTLLVAVHATCATATAPEGGWTHAIGVFDGAGGWRVEEAVVAAIVLASAAEDSRRLHVLWFFSRSTLNLVT